jgi:RNA polymerase sigma-70 factor (TIGR02952 family)
MVKTDSDRARRLAATAGPARAGGRLVIPGRPSMPGTRPQQESPEAADAEFETILQMSSLGVALSEIEPQDRVSEEEVNAIRRGAGIPLTASPPVPARSTTGPLVERPRPDRSDRGDPDAEVWAMVERAQAGEAEAVALIYDRYQDTVFRFVYFRVGNRQLAEDLTADTFLRALKRIGSFTWQGRDLGSWLVTIARNLVADHFKTGRYRLEVTTGDILDADREDLSPEGKPEAAVVDYITNVALLTAVKQLKPEEQECIVLRFLQGFSVTETAQTMGKNEGAIKALQYRAVRALARLLPEGFQW